MRKWPRCTGGGADGYPYPPAATAEQALALGYRAVQMGATSPYAHRSYGFLNSRIGNSEEATRWMRKAYELNTYDLSMAAAYGYALIFSGNYSEGAPIMERAVEASSAHPSWWDYGLFLAQFMLDDMARSARAAEALVTAKRGHYLAVRAIAADCTGKPELARQLLDEIVVEYPKFASRSARLLRQGQISAGDDRKAARRASPCRPRRPELRLFRPRGWRGRDARSSFCTASAAATACGGRIADCAHAGTPHHRL